MHDLRVNRVENQLGLRNSAGAVRSAAQQSVLQPAGKQQAEHLGHTTTY
jgi:hypothetical protein